MSPTLNRSVVTVVIDGYGIAPAGPGNAVSLAVKPNLDKATEQAKAQDLYLEIGAHGPYVGLPDDTMGNSEVGHNALGAGQIYSQGVVLVNEAIASGAFFETENWKNIIATLKKNNSTVHMFGLLSDGNVHSSLDHIYAMLDNFAANGITKISMHPLLDGRDVAPLSGLDFIAKLEAKLATLPGDAKIASGGGRMCCIMDRYESDWKIVERGVDAMVHGIVSADSVDANYSGYFKTSEEAIKLARELYPNKKDQFNPPWVIVDDANKPIGRVEDGDVVINWNFRGDRAVQISRVFDDENFSVFNRDAPEHKFPKALYAGLLEYDSEAKIPLHFCCAPPSIKNTLGQHSCAKGLATYAIAETHKYGHVTYFWNGNNASKFDDKLETWEEVRSEPNEMIPEHPQMKNKEVTDKLVAAIESGKYDIIRCNMACPDMVGHTGIIQAVVDCIEQVDSDMGRVIAACNETNSILIITADHGNSEILLDKKGETVTSHTCSAVPFFVHDPSYDGSYTLSTEGIENAGLANYAATCLDLAGVEVPAGWCKSLVHRK